MRTHRKEAIDHFLDKKEHDYFEFDFFDYFYMVNWTVLWTSVPETSIANCKEPSTLCPVPARLPLRSEVFINAFCELLCQSQNYVREAESMGTEMEASTA